MKVEDKYPDEPKAAAVTAHLSNYANLFNVT